MLPLPISKTLIFADAVKILSYAKESDEVAFDEVVEDSELVANLMDYIGVPDIAISTVFARDDIVSQEQSKEVASKIKEFSYDDILQTAYDFALEYDNSDIDMDSIIPPRKMGYKRVQAVRNGKKVWINKRNPNKHIRLSPKQRQALRKARLKAHSALANYHRAKSSRVRRRIIH